MLHQALSPSIRSKKQIVRIAIFLSALIAVNTQHIFADRPCRMALEKAIPLDGIIHPSGLTIHDGILLAISDQVDDQIYRIELENGKAKAIRWLSIHLPPDENGIRYDLEGIGSSGQNVAILSETRRSVFVIGPDGRVVAEHDIEKASRGGLFAKEGAGPEGLAWSNDRFLIAAERQPVGLIDLQLPSGSLTIYSSNDLPLPMPRDGRPRDLTGLFIQGETVWGLCRNAECIVGMRRDGEGWRLCRVLDFSHVTRAPEYSFVDSRFGTAEGLAMDNQRIYIVLDNNEVARQTNPKDKRPLLLVFAFATGGDEQPPVREPGEQVSP